METVPKNEWYYVSLSIYLLLFQFALFFIGNEEILPLTCTTTSGPDSDKPCVFPFTFAKVTYNNCTTKGNEPGDNKAWCSTKVDESGNHIGGQGNYGFCEQRCQSDVAGKTINFCLFICN